MFVKLGVMLLKSGLMVGLLVLEVVLLPFGDPRRADAGRWTMLLLGSVTAVAAAAFGVFLSWTETYDNPKLYEWFLSHRRGSRSP